MSSFWLFFYSITNSQIRSVEMPLESSKRDELSIYAIKSVFRGRRAPFALSSKRSRQSAARVHRALSRAFAALSFNPVPGPANPTHHVSVFISYHHGRPRGVSTDNDKLRKKRGGNHNGSASLWELLLWFPPETFTCTCESVSEDDHVSWMLIANI